MVRSLVISSWLSSWTVLTPLKAITSPVIAANSAWRRLPAPLSAPLVTVNVAACSGPAKASAESSAVKRRGVRCFMEQALKKRASTNP